MANKPLSMQKIRQVLLLLDRGNSERAIAKQTGISRPTIHQYILLLSATGVDYSQLLQLTDHELQKIIQASKPPKDVTPDGRTLHFSEQVDYFLLELKRVGVTRQLLWEEYLAVYPGGFQYSRFCELLDMAIRTRKPTMQFVHKPAELLQIDFAGAKLSYTDRDTGEIIECPVLVGVFPFSGYAYVRALPNASLPQVINTLNQMLAYFGGTPLNILSDNMKQWVTKTCKYEPSFPDTLEQWSLHNQIGILATRPAKPRDKASIEGQVRITYNRIYALMRNNSYDSLAELNTAILEKLDSHHKKNFQRKTYSRLELFSAEEQSLLRPLPASPYCLRHYTRGKVHSNYHVVVGEDWHYYSVPWNYIGKEVRMVYDSDLVEIYYDHERIALHKRSYKKHGVTTLIEHMPENHKAIAERKGWDPDHYLAKATAHGPSTRLFFEKIMESKITIHQAYGPFLGILRLSSEYGSERVEAACKRALQGYKYNYGIIKNILENKRDLLDINNDIESPIPAHTNIRGAGAY